MRILSGETLPFIEAIKFESKQQLLDKLNRILLSADTLTAPDNLIVKEMINSAIEEIEVCAEHELIRLKKNLISGGKIK